MTTSTVTPEIVSFAQGVRAALADLPADEVDELTDGLEADLAEAYAEDLQRELPDPTAYAAELRLAAGLPVRTKAKGGLFSGLAAGFSDTRRDVGIAIRRNPTLSGIADFLVTLRPVWWVLRAWLATWLVASFFGGQQGYWFSGTGWFLVLAAFVAISAQWGRGHWRSDRALPLIALGNVFAVVALLPVMAAADDGAQDNYSLGYEDAVQQTMQDGNGVSGTSIDGEQVTNIFPFDAKGNPLTGVQLFDQRGRPLAVGSDTTGPECDASCQFDLVRLPSLLDNHGIVWNVFPLREAREEQTTYDEKTESYVLNSGEKASAPTSPYVKVPAVVPSPTAAQPTP